MSDSNTKRFGNSPKTIGVSTRLAYAHGAAKGISVDLLLRKAGLSPAQIREPDARIEVRRQIKFLNLVAEALTDDLLGFHLAQKFDLRTVGLLHYVFASSATLSEAIQRAVRYSSIVNEGITLIYRKGKEFGLAFEYVGAPRHSDRHQMDFWMAAFMRDCRQLTQRSLTADRVSFVHRGNAASELRSFYGCELSFGAETDETIFPLSLRNAPFFGADPYLNKLLVKYCEEAVAHRRTNRGSFGTSVENAIAVLLPHGKAQMSIIARKFFMSRRTLARRLASEGLTFSGVLHALRSDLAKRHLADRDLSISKVAWLVGYNDVTAFSNAFKRWTGLSPRTIRQQHAKSEIKR
ncbi:MAG TPA: AraC family transcriptional regulator [Pseudolabrys sp.]|nr:AraC family transcriptional regulator [Pseudolabrys sp.]